ncbi:hypothetical protein AD006_08060 [Pseudonocardia sp. EC080610-09]|uniref:DUF6925 family protein n=1 Tax=unclassified Pseudonocardia TaxID=2619320 RepID=UPI0007063A0B|nr:MULTISPECIES: hypothetical protein [unclassified Pseudonocardia]ALL75264.1 hypothetical protein AD006_08060 [Pseudonocardia sp. EC080610-09]ALL82289.1 hypothetical protein AD017_15895 [Pseudonocardia sp. EC080619-01]
MDATGTSTVAELLHAYLSDPDAGWSAGAPGAIAEFVRLPDEPAATPEPGAVVTGRGGIRLAAPPGTRPVAYRTPVGPEDHWNHAVALCLPAADARCAARTTVTVLGPDRDALRDTDRADVLVDLGLGTPTVDACVRTGDPELLAALRAAEGRPLDGDLVATLVAAGPHRVFVTAVGRVEVFAAIPPPDGRSPDGPHTHLLPQLLRAGRTHAATVPVPDGYLPCAHLYPAHPLTDLTGRPRPFDAGRLAAFDRLLERFGDPAQRDVTAEVLRAVSAGEPPGDRPADPPGRAAQAVALRVLARTGTADPAVLDAWRGRVAPEPDLLDPDGDRNSG